MKSDEIKLCLYSPYLQTTCSRLFALSTTQKQSYTS